MHDGDIPGFHYNRHSSNLPCSFCCLHAVFHCYILGISVVDEECGDSQVLEVSEGIKYAYSPIDSTSIQPQAEEQVIKSLKLITLLSKPHTKVHSH